MAPSSSVCPLTLLVDQDADTRQMYSEYLTFAGYRVEQASDGRQAVAKAITDLPDFIVTDTQLTGIDGYHLCELLRIDRETRTVPIIVVTSDTRPAVLERAKAIGADAVLIKPCLPATLLAKMNEVRQRSRELRARSVAIHGKVERNLQRSTAALARSARLSRTYQRYETATPSIPPPELRCPRCDQWLTYQRSHVGGVNSRNPEQWDYYECRSGSATFQYRQRTRKVRKVS